MFSMAMWMALIVAPLQIVVGDQHGLNTLKYQPAKVAAMEGHFEAGDDRRAAHPVRHCPTCRPARRAMRWRFPKLGSLILTHDLNGTLRGLKSWPREDWPRVPIVFWSFRVMVGLGLLMIATGIAGLWLRWRRRLYDTPLFARWCLVMGPSGFVALLAGWFVTEVGRQPYTVYGLLRTADSASPIAAAGVAGSLVAFAVVYLIVFGSGIWYLLRLMRADPESVGIRDATGASGIAGMAPVRALGRGGGAE